MSRDEQIPLWRLDGSKAAFALVDADDAALANTLRWHLSSTGRARSNPKQVPTLMHRFLLGIGAGDKRCVDHINGDPLDNRRANLRIVTKGQNNQNMTARKGKTSAYRGVCRRGNGRWRAEVMKDSVVVYRASFEAELDAARAAESARQRLLPFATPDPMLAALEMVA